ncbi:MAG: nucleotidyltransferase family protein [Desulfobacterales bacterium]|jgi:molybdenum cofactor cytidylyltransferase|nr:nucleotidyltransferase family protein [Desulfobacterales bacterium]
MMRDGSVAGIVLAAGEAKRFGGCKQLAKLQGKPLLQWVLDAALASDLDAVILVLGSCHRKVRSVLRTELARQRLQVVINPDFASGQSTSLKAGLERVRHEYSAAMFLLADQPFITSGLINQLRTSFLRSSCRIAVPVFQGRRGNPCIFEHSLYPEIWRVTGDRGARELIHAHPCDVLEVMVSDPAVCRDIDAPEDLDRFTENAR